MFANSEAILAQIDELKKKLEDANRVESKRIQQQINELTNEKNKILREMQKIEEQIEKRQAKIEKLNEQANKMSIKNQVLGKDTERNEYWHFKEEPGKLFVKKFNNITSVKPIIQASVKAADNEIIKVEPLMEDEVPDLPIQPSFTWYYYDEES